MKIARLATTEGPRAAVFDEDAWVVLAADAPEPSRGADGSPALPPPTDERVSADSARFLAPVRPRVVVGMAHNSGEAGRSRPPQAFLRSARTVVGPNAVTRLDATLGRVAAEGELAVVIGRACRGVTPDEAAGVILGYTIADDLTYDEQVPLDSMMTQSKNGDGFTPLGPWIDTDLNPADVPITVAVDGRVVAESSTAGLAYGIAEQVAYLNRFVEFGPGDVILTGSHLTNVPVEAGQDVAITIGGLGTLVHAVR